MSNFVNWFRIRPTVSKPLPKLAKSEDHLSTEINLSSNVQLVINVTSAINLPIRLHRKTPIDNKFTKDQNNSEKIQTFVKVVYQNMQVRTNTVDGQNPCWNEDLLLPLEFVYVFYTRH